ncbi:MAG: 2-isopropylmalate synthase [Rhodospirillales bacterium]|nr:2-isopropylmalate synthase [Rhodospirillales bacterium]
MSGDRIYLYDTTLRDGAQTQGVDFTVPDKHAIAHALDQLGIDYIEGGWPGANPTDDAFFADAPVLTRARFAAFGMTKRIGRSTANDPQVSALFNANTAAICIVGKASSVQVKTALGISPDENVTVIKETVRAITEAGREALFDAEHFFDGYLRDPAYARRCVTAAYEAGARWVVLCDTNGGTLPDDVRRIVGELIQTIPGSHLGIHTHNDTENAVANSLAAVAAGARMIHGTVNGLGERCGNANLITLLPTLMLKMGFETGVSRDGLRQLKHISRMVDDRLNRVPVRTAAYVGESAFAHKGGLHVSAVEKDPSLYEHIEPELVGNARHIIVSDQAGRSNVLSRFRQIGLEVDPKDKRVAALVEQVKQAEYEGYAYDGAEASFELMARRALEGVPTYFRLQTFRILDERRFDAQNRLETLSEATVKVAVGDELIMSVAEGNGPVNALDGALRKALVPSYPELAGIRLVDYKVRILTPKDGTGAVTRVMIESADADGQRWTTVGVSPNIIEASFEALEDSLTWRLFHKRAQIIPLPTGGSRQAKRG